jgi:hypothetical protein
MSRRRGVLTGDDVPRVVVCGSMSAFPEMLRVADSLASSGVAAIVPDVRDDFAAQDSPRGVAVAKRRASMRHIRKILDRRTTAIVVVNVDKDGRHDYIGPNAFAEIAIAFAHGRSVFLLQAVPENYAEELEAWDAVPLRGDLRPVASRVHGHRKAHSASWSQLPLFPLTG